MSLVRQPFCYSDAIVNVSIASDVDYLKASIRYGEDAAVATELLHITPGFLRP